MPSPKPSTRSDAARPLRWLWIALALVALARLADLAVFMDDASATEHALGRTSRELEDPSFAELFFPKHCCFTCYVVAAELAERGEPNLYLAEHYRPEDPDAPPPTETHREIGELLRVDRYQYPPPFLLLPLALERLGGGFLGARRLFFGLELATFTLCLVLLARWLRAAHPPAERGSWIAWLGVFALVLLPDTTLTSLQIGNVHPFVMMLSVLGMLAAFTGRAALGGALLGFVSVGKIFPGLLVLYLAARGRWRAVAWSAGFGVAYVLATFALFGAESFRAFFEYQLPRLASGEAFEFAFRMPRPMLVNASVEGLPHRLGMLGAIEDPRSVGRALGETFGIALLLLTLCVGLRRRGVALSPTDPSKPLGTRRHAELVLWLALLALAQMRSPFLPAGYGAFVFLWLFATRLVAPRVGWGSVVATLLGCGLFALPWPLPVGPATLELDLVLALLASTAGLAVSLGVVVLALRPNQGPDPAAREEPPVP